MEILLNNQNILKYEIKDDINILDIKYDNDDNLCTLIDRLVASSYLYKDKTVLYMN